MSGSDRFDLPASSTFGYLIQQSLTPREFLQNIALNLTQPHGQPLSEFLASLHVALIPTVVLDRRGRTCFCNVLFRKLAEQQLADTSHPPADGLHRVGKLEESAIAWSPRVEAWLDSRSILRRWDIEVFAQSVGTSIFPLTALSILRAAAKPERSSEQQTRHELVNAAASVQVLIDLLEEGGSDQARAEYLKLLQISMHKLRAKIDRQTNSFDSPCWPAWQLKPFLETLAQHYRSLAAPRKCRIQMDGVTDDLSEGHISVDPGMIGSLERGLSNVFARARERGLIRISCQRVEAGIEVRVQCSNAVASSVSRGTDRQRLNASCTPHHMPVSEQTDDVMSLLLPLPSEASPLGAQRDHSQTGQLKRCG